MHTWDALKPVRLVAIWKSALTGLLIGGSALIIGGAAFASGDIMTLKFADSKADHQERVARLTSDLHVLASDIGERNLLRYDAYLAAKHFISNRFSDLGYEPVEQVYQVEGRDVTNVYVTIEGSDDPSKHVVIGAHYDSVEGAPGANDNGTGVVALLEIARTLQDAQPKNTLILVAFANEEPPHFQKDTMGSLLFARMLKAEGVNVVSMISLETMGYFTEERNSQRYPFPLNLFYPDTGDFIGVVSDNNSSSLATQLFEVFEEIALIPVEKASLPGFVPGTGWSDQWSFWQNGYKGVMLTDTAPYRYPYYHTAEDTPDKVDYERLAKVTQGVLAYLNKFFY